MMVLMRINEDVDIDADDEVDEDVNVRSVL